MTRHDDNRPGLRAVLRRDADLSFVGEVLRWDLGLGLAGGVGTAVWASRASDFSTQLATALQVTAGLVAIVVGAMAIITAFLDQVFLRKLLLLPSQPRPGYFLAPFLWTAILGVLAMAALAVAWGVQGTDDWRFITAAFVAGLLTVWSFASLLPDLAVVVELAEIKMDVAELPDDFEP